jgi:hypothetical protein
MCFFAASRAAAFLQWCFVPSSPLGGRSFRACDVNSGGRGIRGATSIFQRELNDPGPVCGGAPDGELSRCFRFRWPVRIGDRRRTYVRRMGPTGAGREIWSIGSIPRSVPHTTPSTPFSLFLSSCLIAHQHTSPADLEKKRTNLLVTLPNAYFRPSTSAIS